MTGRNAHLGRIAACSLVMLLGACGDPGPDATSGANRAGQAESEAAKATQASLDVEVDDRAFARIERFETPGGVSVWLVNEPSIPIVSLNIAWPGGRASDPEGQEGLASALAYQMNEGAGDLDALAFQTRMEELNMSFGCSAGRDWMSCSADMLRENADEAMDLVALAFEAPRVDEGPFERFRREQRVSIRQRATNPRFLAREAVEDRLYPDHAYARDTRTESIEALSREAVRAHKDRIMVNEGMLVTVVGAITPQALAPLLDDALAGLPQSGELTWPAPVTLAPPPAEPVVIDLPQPQSLVSFTAPGPQRDHPDFFAAYVLNYTLGGGGFESRLMNELREGRGLTYGVGTRLSFGGELATWSGAGQTRNATAGEFLNVLKAELARLAEAGVTEAELADAKAYLTGAYPLGFDSNSKIAANLMGVRQQGLGVDYFDRRNGAVEAVTRADVARVAREWLDPARFLYVLVGQPEGLDSAPAPTE